jgi:hypothetical protein
LTVERNGRIANKTGRWNKMPGLFLPLRLLELLYKVNPNPSDDIFSEIALLVWIPVNEVKRYFKDANEQDLLSFKQDKARDKCKTIKLYKINSCQELQEKCKKSGLPCTGLKYQLVE